MSFPVRLAVAQPAFLTSLALVVAILGPHLVPSSGGLWAFSCCVIAAFSRIRAAWGSCVTTYPDTLAMRFVASAPNPLTTTRPPVIAIWYRAICGRDTLFDTTRLARAQTVLSALAWSTLILCMVRRTPDHPTICALAGIGLSSSRTFAKYDFMALADAVCIASTATFLAVLWLWWGDPNALASTALAVCAAAWIFTRDTHAYGAAALIIAIGLADYFGARRISSSAYPLPLCVTALAIAASAYGAARAERWIFPFINVLSRRILTDTRRREWFAQRGLPISPRLLSLSGEWASGQDWAYFRDPELEQFRVWVKRSGRSIYARFLLAHPSWAFGELFANFERIVTPHDGLVASDYVPLLPFELIGEDSRLETAIIFFSLLMLGVVALACGRPLTVVLTIASLTQAFVIFHGDAMEVSRHSLTCSLQLRFAVFTAIVDVLPSCVK